ncbi:hypothetical protein QFC21_005771 [Naganishia friedmannii]|uniref:Uncharacterized protein n=1 Tax=Naganishia friedmannii TaxID=89922 RepID=A0ACC2V752_9TREE|nr:hypothetical protein QFC21_005771 [Naganishia friedmannii]
MPLCRDRSEGLLTDLIGDPIRPPQTLPSPYLSSEHSGSPSFISNERNDTMALSEVLPALKQSVRIPSEAHHQGQPPYQQGAGIDRFLRAIPTRGDDQQPWQQHAMYDLRNPSASLSPHLTQQAVQSGHMAYGWLPRGANVGQAMASGGPPLRLPKVGHARAATSTYDLRI